MGAESYTIKTGVDKLVDLIQEKKRVSIEEAAKILSVPKVLVEEWADFLEEKEVIGIEYKFTVPYLVYKELSKEVIEERAKQFAGRREGFVRKVESILDYLDKQSGGLANLKAEFKGLTNELDSKIGLVKGELNTLSRYEQMKREVDGQILEQQREFEGNKKAIMRQIMAKKKAVHRMLEQIDAQENTLEREEKLAGLLKKNEEEIEQKLRRVFKEASDIEVKIRLDEPLISGTVKKIADFKRLSESAKSEIKKQEAALAPLIEESKKHEKNIAELKRRFLEKVSELPKGKSGLSRSSANEMKSKFKQLFAKKDGAERLVNKLDADLNALKGELKALSEEAMVMRLASKSKPVADYVKEFEEKFNSLNEKKQKLQGELGQLAGTLKKF